MSDLPRLALSVRQPWAWAIIHGGKVIENRSAGSIRAGKMGLGPICIHAASGLRRDEYEWGLWRLTKHGVVCPRPEALVRRAIIGVVDVVEIISESDSEWFGGAMGLRLENPRAVEPIPCAGELGYFAWERSGAIEPPKPWMLSYASAGQGALGDLFDDWPPHFETPPPKPF